MPKSCDTPEKVEEWKAKMRAYFKARNQTPERKAADKAYQKAYSQTPECKAYHKARQQTPEFKAYHKARNQTPECKAYHKAYRQTPEFKAAKKARNKAHYQTLSAEQSTADAFRMMQAASELAKALTNLSEPTPQNK